MIFENRVSYKNSQNMQEKIVFEILTWIFLKIKNSNGLLIQWGQILWVSNKAQFNLQISQNYGPIAFAYTT